VAIWGNRKSDRVAEDLLHRIVGGDLAVGSLLPTEAEIARAYQVNRSVVREATKTLEVAGLVRPIRRRGTEVLDPLCSPSPDVLRAMLKPRPGRVDRQALTELLEVRAALDAEMSGLAAHRRDDEDLAALDRVVAALAEAVGQPDRYAAVMDDLALAIARATHNRIYQMLVNWHRRVRGDVDAMNLIVRLANEAHLSGVRFLVELIREGEAEQVRGFVAAVHEWATPRMLAAVALASGESIERAMEGIQ